MKDFTIQNTNLTELGPEEQLRIEGGDDDANEVLAGLIFAASVIYTGPIFMGGFFGGWTWPGRNDFFLAD